MTNSGEVMASLLFSLNITGLLISNAYYKIRCIHIISICNIIKYNKLNRIVVNTLHHSAIAALFAMN